MLIMPDKSNIYNTHKKKQVYPFGGINMLLAFFIFELSAFVYFDCPWIFKNWMLAERRKDIN